MTESSKNNFVERRRGRDRLLRIMSGLGIVGCFLFLLVALIVLDRAKPDDPTFIPNERIFERSGIPYHLQTAWDQDL